MRDITLNYNRVYYNDNKERWRVTVTDVKDGGVIKERIFNTEADAKGYIAVYHLNKANESI